MRKKFIVSKISKENNRRILKQKKQRLKDLIKESKELDNFKDRKYIKALNAQIQTIKQKQ